MSDFTGNKIKDTFQRVLQVDGGNIQNGTGNLVDATINSLTASNGFQGNIDGTSSYALTSSYSISSSQAISASYVQNAQTSSYYAETDPIFVAKSGSLATTGSNTFVGTQTIQGLTRITGTSTNDLVRITQTGTGAAFLVEDSTNPDSTPFVIDNAGSVGIGTLTASAKLTISASGVNGILLGTDISAGNQERSGRLLFGQQDPTKSTSISAISGSIYFATSASFNVTTGQTRMVISSSGNVGIGTTTPNAKLDVNGSVIITGSLTISGSSTFTNIGPANFTGSLAVTGSTNLIGLLTISGSTTDKVELSLPLTSSQNISSSLDVIARTGSFDYIKDRGNAVIDGDLVVNGSVTLAGGLQFGPTFATGSLTANTNNLLIANLANSILVRLTSTGNNSLTGIVIPDNTKTYFFNVFNVGVTGNINFKNNDASSDAQNRFLIGSDINVQPGEGLSFIYDPVDLRWRSPGKNI